MESKSDDKVTPFYNNIGACFSLPGLGTEKRETPMDQDIRYLSGFGNQMESEALPGALPAGQNSPQKVPYGLYAEQLSGSAFTAARSENLRSWLYRIRPSVLHGPFQRRPQPLLLSSAHPEVRENVFPPTQMRWDPLPMPDQPTDFLCGMVTFAICGDLSNDRGGAIHLYAANAPMGDTYFYNADGHLVIVPQQGGIQAATEFGALLVNPGEVAIIPRGIKFQINPLAKEARGYVAENYGRPFRLPDLGPIGSNGLANPRDFLTPTARYQDKTGAFSLVAKFGGYLWQTPLGHCPLDVVAWHGNYYPYKYDLSLFNTINTVSFDHPDPSIFTVLTSPSEVPGTANMDFVIFPPRWMVAEHTFRPPYYHRNCMSEFMGLIRGVYDAKPQGFVPGCGSLHNRMSAHGPDKESFEAAVNADLKPRFLGDTLAFMFEVSLPYRPTPFALNTPLLQKDYLACWGTLKSHFDPKLGPDKRR